MTVCMYVCIEIYTLQLYIIKPTISAGERPQTYALDRAASGPGALQFTTPN